VGVIFEGDREVISFYFLLFLLVLWGWELCSDLAHIKALYDGEIAWLDHHIGMLVKEMERRGLDERISVVLTSDHGDAFFEHGEKGNMHSLYEELLHVPLILRGPGVQVGRITERVELIDRR
jgi:arylsulfatase A-like enzyme